MARRKTRSAKQVEKYVAMTAIWLGQMVPKHEVKRRLRQAFIDDGLAAGPISWRTCETYISRARQLLIEWHDRTPRELHIEAVAFYVSVIQHPGSSEMARLTARQRLDRLFGLETPTILRLVGDADNPLAVKVKVEEYLAGKRRAQALERALLGTGPGHGNGQLDPPANPG
jgi:hypothetical protein